MVDRAFQMLAFATLVMNCGFLVMGFYTDSRFMLASAAIGVTAAIQCVCWATGDRN